MVVAPATGWHDVEMKEIGFDLKSFNKEFPWIFVASPAHAFNTKYVQVCVDLNSEFLA